MATGFPGMFRNFKARGRSWYVCVGLHLPSPSHGMGVFLSFSPMLKIVCVLCKHKVALSLISHRTGDYVLDWWYVFEAMTFSFPFYIYTPACSLRTTHTLCTWTWSLQPIGSTMKCRIQSAHPWGNMEYYKHMWVLVSSMSSINNGMQDLSSCPPSALLLLLRDLNKYHSNQGKHLPMTEEVEHPSVKVSLPLWETKFSTLVSLRLRNKMPWMGSSKEDFTAVSSNSNIHYTDLFSLT